MTTRELDGGAHRCVGFYRQLLGYWQQNPPCSAFLASARAHRQCFEQACREYAIQLKAGHIFTFQGRSGAFRMLAQTLLPQAKMARENESKGAWLNYFSRQPD